MFTHDATTFEIGQARLRLRDGLRFTLHQNASLPWFLIEDEISGQYFRVGLPEYTLLSVLDGKKSLSEAVAETSALLGGQAFGERQVANLCRWVIESGLAETDASRASRRIEEKRKKELTQKRISWLNPISFKFPLFNPDAYLTQLHRLTGWMFTVPAAIICSIMIIVAAVLLFAHWDEIFYQRIQTFSSNDFLWIVVSWVALRAIHETAHGLTCKNFGGEVPQTGILLLLLLPLPYVDVTSSWRFGSKYQRILTAAAGMMVELFVAAIAIFIWYQAEPGAIRYHAENVIFVATIGSILFNANPLMRFDGYYILADFVEIPNLYQNGRQYVKQWMKWAFLATAKPKLIESGRRARMIKVYGFLSTIWFFLITVSLMLGAAGLLDGIGLIVALVGAFLWFGIPIIRFVKMFLRSNEEQIEPINRVRFLWMSTACVVALLLAGWLLPGPSVFTAPVVIEYETQTDVRSEVSGFLKEISVDAGMMVAAGDVIARLENRELELEQKSITVNIREAELRAVTRLNASEIAAWQVEQESLDALNKRLTELNEQLEMLTVLAPHSGVVLSSELDSKAGTFIRPGDSIMEIGVPSRKRAIAMVKQSDSVWLREKKLKQIRADVEILGTWKETTIGIVDSMQPRAQDHVPHPALAATYGGPLSVIERSQVDESESVTTGMVRGTGRQRRGLGGELIDKANEPYSNLKLVTPRVKVALKLDQESRDRLAPGQIGYAHFRSRNQSLGPYFVSNIYNWFRTRITKTHGI